MRLRLFHWAQLKQTVAFQIGLMALTHGQVFPSVFPPVLKW
ncbi:hypothetical protein SAMN05444062_101416 [Pseudomonas syringae]|uniref:Uncharacterized protein n=1 Tax=Pseudomonas syringae TaxID=317 RepID=A0AB38BMX5_PSESX|nr:hypothetical protein SAMN05444062_101416 [Pseudomonas syringae]SFN57620.1 hypothetical protein SAMN05444065_101272 [Pseudomonas syringae]SFO40830.1 hypothetical protein SAMN05444063_105272 [Pseudomonas syringae]